MKRKTKKAIKSPQRSLTSYIEEFAVLLRRKAEGAPDQKSRRSPSSNQIAPVIEQIAMILRKQTRTNSGKVQRKVAVKTRKPKRIKK